MWNFTKLSMIIGRSSLRCKFVSKFEYLAAFSYEGGSKLRDVENNASLHFFENSGEVGEISGSKLYLRPNLWNTFDGHPLRGC